ncbi:hypothetical protein NIBR502774_18645 (plasmid) [Rhizobium sp. NIBRBAC000502774]|nr:hypothetical protein NIBR502774_18645 [Rhizobium sp. NIBRBAC000502774]
MRDIVRIVRYVPHAGSPFSENENKRLGSVNTLYGYRLIGVPGVACVTPFQVPSPWTGDFILDALQKTGERVAYPLC